MSKYKNCLTYGTFDVFHKGHERLLRRIKEQCETLHVGVSSDNWNSIKNKTSIQDEQTRLTTIKSLGFVDGTFFEDHNSFEESWVEKYNSGNFDALIMGSDHTGNLDYLIEKGINIQYLPRTQGISSSMIKEDLSKLKVGITYGTFDLLHYGHINILKEAKKGVDYLVVGISTDEFNEIKGKKAHESFATRKQNMLNTGLVDLLIIENEWDQKPKDMIKYNVVKFTMGSDWTNKFDDLASQTRKVYYAKRTEGISSTQLREELNEK